MAKLLIISDLWRPFPGGAEAYIARVADALHERGHDIHILTSYAKAKSSLPMTIADIGVNERYSEGLDLLQNFILDYAPDLVLTHHFFAGAFERLWSLIEQPFIEIVHNRQRHPDAALAIFNSRFTANKCGYRPETDIVMLPPATPDCVACFKPGCRLVGNHGHGQQWHDGKPNWKEVDRDCIGHIKPLGGKGIDLTYKLARIMPERKFLILRGEWQDGEKIERYDNVEFMEPVDDIREFWARCRLLLMPSLSEDAGTCPQEAALNGIPCISSNVGGLPETNFGGITLPPDDPYPWITEICKLDHAQYYKEVVVREWLFIETLDFPAQFDALEKRIRGLV